MNFGVQFIRQFGGSPAGVPLVGADADPRTFYGTPGVAPQPWQPNVVNVDNVLMTRHYSRIASPYKRVAVSYTGPTGAPTLTATAYVWEELTGHWYMSGTTKSSINLVLNAITMVTIPTIGEQPPQATKSQSQSAAMSLQPFGRNPGIPIQGDPGGLAVMLCVDLVGTTAGVYQFAMAPSFADNIT